ncbi:hypothetical protein K488DRAFT_87738 [Vararia minispora EC-137]|uniref:Uncharacterized protein n=1 Tax=Vararia minispora EC-137 TaxID=1314806 RepID=A0ACB8QFX8_9AGAM|nr:hypothetical protein K488DRAFT_87738 [Vararia minispora EC-137]
MADDAHRGFVLAVDSYPRPESRKSHILSLPPEIALFIFSILAEEYPPSLHRDSPLDRLGWIIATHLPRALPEFIERAGDALPVDLTAWVKELQGPESNVWFSDGKIPLSRIRSMEVHVVPHTQTIDPRLIPMLAGGEAPILEYFAVRQDSLLETRRVYDVQEPLHAPCLLYASLQGCFFAFRAPSLTFLSLSSIALMHHTAVLAILDIISNSPLLKWLSIRKLLISQDAFRNVDASKRPAHHLERIVLESLYTFASSHLPYTCLLDRLAIPSSTIISIIDSGDSDFSSTSTAIPLLMSVTRSIWRDDPPVGLEIDLAGGRQTVSFFSFVVDAPPQDSSLFLSSATLRAEFWNRNYLLSAVLRHIASEIDLSTITVLSVRGGRQSRSERTNLVDLFAVLPGVRMFYLVNMVGEHDSPSFRALEKSVGDSLRPLLPHLERIWFVPDAISTVHSAYHLLAEGPSTRWHRVRS